MSITKRITICSVFILAIICCFICFTLRLSAEKAAYSQQLNNHITQYLTQQKFMLQRLANNLVITIKHGDNVSIAQQLHAYEEIIFSLSKHGLAIPVSIHLASLNAMQQTVGSFGETSASVLAPDEAYYTEVMEHPDRLALSALYTNQAMPEYPLLNIGLGIVDSQHNYLGQLDLQIAVNALREHIERQTMPASLFTFKFADHKLQPQIQVVKSAAWYSFIKYASLRLSTLVIVLFSATMAHKLYSLRSSKLQQLAKTQQRLLQTEQELIELKSFIAVQNYYATLANNKLPTYQVIDLQQLLSDVKTINTISAAEHSISLKFPERDTQMLRFYGYKLRLMQLLSGVLYQLILHNNSTGTIELKIQTVDNINGQQQLIFIFSDNGFYDQLQNNACKLPLSDVRSRGWDAIADLSSLEGASLEHVHTAYAGNTISLTMDYKSFTNVVSLEAFMDNPLYET